MKVDLQINRQVNDTNEEVIDSDHYLTWAPTTCRVRLVDGAEELRILLTNGRHKRFIFIDSLVKTGDLFDVVIPGKTLQVVADSASREKLATKIATAVQASEEGGFSKIDATADNDTVTLFSSDLATIQSITLSSSQADGSSAQYHAFELAESGVVNFGQHKDPAIARETASEQQLEIALPADGSWVYFVIAGRFGYPSYNDRDAIIEARDQGPDGKLLAQVSVMVRVRRNLLSLTYRERIRLMEAIAKLHFSSSIYKNFVSLHTMGTPMMQQDTGRRNRDQGHDGPGFLPWHRAFLLLFEYSLQQQDAGMALHYWQEEGPSKEIFSEEFMGANVVNQSTSNTPVLFDLRDPTQAHPLSGWSYEQAPLSRAPNSRDAIGFRINKESALVNAPHYYSDNGAPNRSFADLVENNPHNRGHGWVGSWMASCKTSPRDPIFWLFHSDIDRLWARWQHVGNRFGNDGSDTKDYFPTGARPPKGIHTLGHYLLDTMWPWDGVTGDQDINDEKDDRPKDAPGGPFPTAPVRGNWPAEPETNVRPADMIDYLGFADRGKALGFCYDDSPYNSPTQVPAATISIASAERIRSFSRFTKSSNTTDLRLQAAGSVESDQITPEETELLISSLLDVNTSEELQNVALELLDDVSGDIVRLRLLDVLASADHLPENILLGVIDKLWTQTMFTNMGMQNMHATKMVLVPLLEHKSEFVRLKVFGLLAVTGDSKVAEIARQSVTSQANGLLTRVQALEILSHYPSDATFNALRPLIRDADPELRLGVVRILANDAASGDELDVLVRNDTEVPEIRAAAIQYCLSGNTVPLINTALTIANDDSNSEQLRLSSLNGLAIHAKRYKQKLEAQQLKIVFEHLNAVPVGNNDLMETARRNAVNAFG